MAYTRDQWRERHNHRSDISAFINHLTREATIDGREMSAVDVLLKILREQRIIASTTETGFIVGTTPAVCFQAAPLLGLAENIRDESHRPTAGGRVRYRGVGLGFGKTYACKLGCRPVIYEQTAAAKRLLPPDQWWRIVNMDMRDDGNIVDWSHEREWRCSGDFTFQRGAASVVVWGTPEYREFMGKAEPELLKDLIGVTVLKSAIA